MDKNTASPAPATYDGPLSAEQIALGLHQYAKPRRGWHVETQPALRGEIALLETKGHKAAAALQANYHFPTRLEQVRSDNYVVADREAAETFVRRRIAKSLVEHGELPGFLDRAARRAENQEARRQGWAR